MVSGRAQLAGYKPASKSPPSAIVTSSVKKPDDDNPVLKLASSIGAAESLFRPRFHFYSDMHKRLAESRERDSSAAVDPRGELVFFETGVHRMIRTEVKTAAWKVKQQRRRPAGLVADRSLVPMGIRGE